MMQLILAITSVVMVVKAEESLVKQCDLPEKMVGEADKSWPSRCAAKAEAGANETTSTAPLTSAELPLTAAPRGYYPSAAAEGRPRQAEFGEAFHDIFDYIDAITYAIWERREVGLVRNYYSEDCPIHTLAGQVQGSEKVIAATWRTLAAFPDRTLFPEGLVWSKFADGKYMSSHLIDSGMTNRGDSEYGPATGKFARIRVIAHFIIEGDKIVREWLVRDNYQLAVQLGYDPAQIAKKQGATNPSVEHAAWLQSEFARVQAQEPVALDAPEAVLTAARKLSGVWSAGGLSAVSELYHPHAIFQGPAARDYIGHDAIWLQYYHKILSTLDGLSLSIDHVAANTREATEDIALGRGWVAVRWTIAGKHTKEGLWGTPSGADLVIIGESHLQFVSGLIIKDITVFDELSVLTQIERARKQLLAKA